MAHVTPYFDDVRDLTYKCNSAVIGGRLVQSVAGNDRVVEPAGAGSTSVKGMAMYDGATGDKVSVARQQVLPARASGAIVAGNKLVAAAAGDVAAAGATPDARTVVGEALQNASNGTVFRALIY